MTTAHKLSAAREPISVTKEQISKFLRIL